MLSCVSLARSTEAAPTRISARDCGSVASQAPAATGRLTRAADQSSSPGPKKASAPETMLTRPTRAGGSLWANAEPTSAKLSSSRRRRDLARRRMALPLKIFPTTTDDCDGFVAIHVYSTLPTLEWVLAKSVFRNGGSRDA